MNLKMAQDIVLSGDKQIGSNHPTFIIAEIGQNHQGHLETAKVLIETAKECGADCVKFQKTCISEKFNSAALQRQYNNQNSWGETYGEHKSYLEFSDEQFVELQKYAASLGILFTASAMDTKSLSFLYSINVPFIKIGSGDCNNYQLIEIAARMQRSLVISTGMQDFEMVKSIYRTIRQYHKNFCLLHCVSAYPAPLEEINLNVLKLYQKEFPDINIGYSGHEIGIDISIAAVALGAKIIERHITLSHNQKGSDHMCSLEPREFKLMVHKIRTLEVAMGIPEKKLQPCEIPCKKKLGKSLVLARSITKGHRLSRFDIKVKVAEPQGLDGWLLDNVIGKSVNKDMEEDETLTADCLE